MALSRRVPVLENIGFRVISERTFEVGDDQVGTINSDRPGLVFIHDMELENSYGQPIDLTDGGALFEDAFLSVWRGDVDNDGYNGLAQTAGLWSGEITICAPMAVICSRSAFRKARISSPPRSTAIPT